MLRCTHCGDSSKLIRAKPDIRLTRFRAGSDRIRAHVPPFDFRSFLPPAYDSPYSSAPTIFAFAQPLQVSAQSKHASHALRWLGLVRQRPRIVVSHIPRLYICCAPKSPSLTCICNRFRPPTPVQPLSLTTRDNGSSRPMRALLQNDQIRHNPYSLELQHVPFRASLVHLRMPTLQVEDVQAVHVQGLSGGWLTRGTQPKPQNPKALFSYASFPRGAAAFQLHCRRPETRRNLIKQKKEEKRRKKETPKMA